MKRERFRLGSVLKHYKLQKQRAEQDLSQASRELQKIDDEIARLHAELTALAESLTGTGIGSLSVSGWMACNRRSGHLARSLDAARVQRERQAAVVAKCVEQRKRWAVAEETLLSLERQMEAANQTEEAKTLQVQLQETILRRWLDDDAASRAP